MKFKIPVLLIVLLFYGCASKIKFNSERANCINLYEVTTRIYSEKNQLKVITADLPRIKSLFFNVIALQSPMSYDMSQNAFNPGNPFAINDFKNVDLGIGSNNDLTMLIDSSHIIGISVLLEFNFNLTGPNHNWRLTKPELYMSSDKIVDGRYNPEYVQLDLTNNKAADLIFDAFRETLDNFAFDGAVIYDLDKTPLEFQDKVFNYMKSNPTKLFIHHGESEVAHVSYNMNMKHLYTLFHKTYNDSSFVEDYVRYLEYAKSHPSTHATLDYFVNFYYGTDVQFYYNAYKYFVMFCAFAPGISWTMNGQEGPLFEPVNLFSTKTIKWNFKYMQDQYRSLNLQKLSNPALWNSGSQNYPEVISDSKDVLALERRNGEKYCVLLFNLRNKESRFKIMKNYSSCNDLFNKVPVRYMSDTTYSLGPLQAVMFSNVL